MTHDEREIWAALELPEPAAAPPGFAASVLARARTDAAGGGVRLASGWGRLAAAGVVAAGIAGGVVLALWTEVSSASEAPFAWTDSTLAEQYLAGFGSAGDAGASR